VDCGYVEVHDEEEEIRDSIPGADGFDTGTLARAEVGLIVLIVNFNDDEDDDRADISDATGVEVRLFEVEELKEDD